MSFYLAQYGGADTDRAYKDTGDLTIIGPFDNEGDAWDIARFFDAHFDYDRGHAPQGFDSFEGTVTSTVMSPEARLREWAEMAWWDDPQGPDAQVPEDTRVLLDRWWPSWPAEFARNHDPALWEESK